MPLPSWWSGSAERKARNRRSGAQERARATEIGGRASSGSGSSWRRPQDVRNVEYLEQLKFSDARSFTLRVAEWEQLRANALREGKEPRMVIELPGVRLIVHEA